MISLELNIMMCLSCWPIRSVIFIVQEFMSQFMIFSNTNWLLKKGLRRDMILLIESIFCWIWKFCIMTIRIVCRQSEVSCSLDLSSSWLEDKLLLKINCSY